MSFHHYAFLWNRHNPAYWIPQRVGSLGLHAFISFVARIVLATLVMSLSLLITCWLLDMALVTTGVDGNQSLTVAGIAMALLKLASLYASVASSICALARFLRALDPRRRGLVNRLLVRLYLAWI